MAEKRRKLKAALANTLDLPEDLLDHLPVLHLTGKQRLWVENHRGLIAYDPRLIRIRTHGGVIEVAGESLLLKNLGPEELLILGTIEAVDLKNMEG